MTFSLLSTYFSVDSDKITDLNYSVQIPKIKSMIFISTIFLSMKTFLNLFAMQSVTSVIEMHMAKRLINGKQKLMPLILYTLLTNYLISVIVGFLCVWGDILKTLLHLVNLFLENKQKLFLKIRFYNVLLNSFYKKIY